MASVSRPPIQTATEFQRALSEVERLLETPPAPASLEDRWFNHLLEQIADFHESQPLADRQANSQRLLDLDRHLQLFGKRWRGSVSGSDDHWSPLIGGDLDPGHHRH